MGDDQFGFLTEAYKRNPFAFTVEQTDALDNEHRARGLRLERNKDADNFSLLRTVEQVGSGFLSGLTTLQIGDAPQNVTEEIARSAGNLLGFVGFVPGGGTAGQFAIKTTLRGFGMSTAKATAKAARIGAGAKALRGKSVPLLVADKIAGNAAVTRRIQQTFGRGTLADIVEGGLHLGTASSVSAWQYGVDEMMKAFGHGFIAGGAFRGIGNVASQKNFPTLSKNQLKIARGVAGSLFTGLPLTLQDAPMPVQVYEYMLGAYFGVHELPKHLRDSKRFQAEYIKEQGTGIRALQTITQSEGFKRLTDEAQDAVRQDAMELVGRQVRIVDGALAGQDATDAQGLIALALDGTRLVDTIRWKELWRREIEKGTPEDEAFDIVGRAMAETKDEARPIISGKETDLAPEEYIGVNVAEAREAMLDHDVPNSLRNPMVDFVNFVMDGAPSVRKADGKLEQFNAETMTNLIAEVFATAKRGGRGFESAVEDLRVLFDNVTTTRDEGAGDLLPSRDSREYRLMKQAWNRVTQTTYRVPKYFAEQGSGGYRFSKMGDKDPKGNSVKEYAQPSLLEDMMQEMGIGVLQVDEIRTGREQHNIHAPEGVASGGITNLNDGIRYIFDSATRNMPFLAGVKDKQRLMHGDGWVFEKHGVRITDADGTSKLVKLEANAADAILEAVNSKVSELDRIDPGAKEAFMKNFQSFAEALPDVDPNAAREVYAKTWLNNVAMLERMQGFTLPEMVAANKEGRGQFLLRVQDVNKRMQLMMDRGLRPDAESFGSDGLDFIILNDSRGGSGTAEGLMQPILQRIGKSGKVEDYIAEHHLDGVFMVHPDVFDRLSFSAGLDANTGAIKGSMAYRGETIGPNNSPLGMMLGKYAIFRASEGATRAMENAPKPVQGMMFSSAAKQRGMRKKYDVHVKQDGTTQFYSDGSPNPNPFTKKDGTFEVYRAPIEGLRLNASSSEDPIKNVKDVDAAIQLIANIENPAAARAMFNQYVLPSIVGKPEANRVVEEWLVDPSVDVSKVRLDDIGVGLAMRILNQPESDVIKNSALYKRLWRDVLKRYDTERFSDLETISPEDIIRMRESDGEGFATQMYRDMLAGDTISPFMMNSDLFVGPHAQKILLSHLVRRAQRPRIKNSGQSVLGPQDPWFQMEVAQRHGGKGLRKSDGSWLIGKDGFIQEGAMMLDDGWRGKMIDWVGGESKKFFRGVGKDGDLAFTGPEGSSFGSGIYLTSNKEIARRYGSSIEEYYIDIKKPYTIRSDADIIEMFRAAGIKDPEMHLQETWLAKYEDLDARIGKEEARKDPLHPDNVKPQDFLKKQAKAYATARKYLESQGYDSLIVKTGLSGVFKNVGQKAPSIQRRFNHDQVLLFSDKSIVKDGTPPPARRVTLEQAWNEYQNTTDKKLRSQMEDKLSFDVIRVPADSPSGIRRLQFSGFTGARGAGTRLNNLDMVFLGGADLDIDKVFLYQNLDRAGGREIGDYLKSPEVRYQWLDKKELKKGNKVVIDTKSEMLNGRVLELEPHERHSVSIADPRLLFRTSRGASLGNGLIDTYAVVGRRGHVMNQLFEEVTPENYARFSKMRSGGLNMAADAGDTAGLRIDNKQANRELMEALFGGNVPKGARGVMESMVTMDKFAKGNLGDDPVVALNELRAARANLGEVDNAWYSGISRLSEEIGFVRAIEGQGAGGAETSQMQQLTRLVNGAGFNELMKRVNEINSLAYGSNPDPVAKAVVELVARFDVGINNQRRIRRASGEKTELVQMEYKHPWQIYNDIFDAASLINIYEKGNRVVKNGGSVAEIMAVAKEAEAYRREYSEVMNSTKEFDKIDGIYERAIDYRNTLSSRMQEYFDAYALGTYRPQDQPLSQFYDNAFARFEAWYKPKFFKDNGRNPSFKEIKDQWDGKVKSQARKFYYHTQQTRFGFDPRLTSQKSRIEYMRAINKIVDGTISGDTSIIPPETRKKMTDPTTSPTLQAVLGERAAFQPAMERSGQTTAEFIEKTPALMGVGKDAINPDVVGKKAAAENRTRVEKLKVIFDRFPHIAENIEDAFKSVTLKRSANDISPFGVSLERSTLVDLDKFISFFQKGIEGKLGDPKEVAKFDPLLASIVFPDYYGTLTRGADVQISTNKVMRPILTNKGIVNQEIREVFNSFDKAYEIFSTLENRSSQRLSAATVEFESSTGFIRGALGKDYTALHEIAVTMRESGRGGDAYVEAAKNASQRLNTFAKKTYILNGKKITARQAVGEINKLYDSWFTRYKDNVLTSNAKDDPFVVRTGEVMHPGRTLDKIAAHVQRHGDIPDISYAMLHELQHMTKLSQRLRTEAVYTKDSNGTYRAKRLLSEREQAPLDTLRRNKKITEREYRDTLEFLASQYPSEPVELMDPKTFWSHNNHDPRAVKKWLDGLIQSLEQEGLDAATIEKRVNTIKQMVAKGADPDGGLPQELREQLLDRQEFVPEPGSKLTTTPYFAKQRAPDDFVVPGWSKTDQAFTHYIQNAERARYNAVKALLGNRIAISVRNNPNYGSYAEQWAKFMEMYINTTIGGPQFFPDSWLRDPAFGLKKTPTYWLSDQAVFNKLKDVDTKWFKGKLGVKDMKLGSAKSQGLLYRLARFSRMEAQYEMMTLLFNTRTPVNNIFGGSLHTGASTGFANIRDAGNINVLRQINPEWRDMKDVERFVIERIGAFESYVANEGHIPNQFRSGKARAFWDEAVAAMKKDPLVEDATLLDIARKHGIQQSIFEGSAWFMRASERALRRRSAMAHYLQAYKTLQAHGGVMRYDDPWLLEMARKGTEATQFMYDNANRPAFSRSSMGKVLTRFQVWTWRSVDFQRKVFKDAADLGFKKGTEEYDRFTRLAVIDSFVMALAAMFPFSLFDNSLPAPFNHLKEMSSFVFGDEDERDRAFMGQVPFPFSPIGAVLPPSSRPFTTAFNMLTSGDTEKFSNYHIINMIPFGIMARNVNNAIDNPSRLIDIMTGIPVNTIKPEIVEKMDMERGQQ